MDQGLQAIQNVIPLPLYGPEMRRVGESNPGGTPQVWEQRYFNCWPEFAVNPGNPNVPADMYLVKRSGLQTGAVLSPTIGSYGTISTMSCKQNVCMTQLTDVYVAVFWDSTASKHYIIQYRPIAGTTTKIGELTATAATDYVFVTEIIQNVGGTYPAGTLTPAIAVTWMNSARTSGAGYYATSSSGVFGAASLTSISSTSFPSNLVAGAKVITGKIVQLNGVSYVMTIEGTIYGSGGSGGTLYDITTWNTNTIVAASLYPDLGVGLERYKNLIVALGQSSIEFFQDAGVPPPNSPLERVEQAAMKIGVASPAMCINIDDTIYWVAYSKDASLGVWRMDGFTPVKISTPYIDYGLATSNLAGFTALNSSLECVLINYKKHLLINGCVQNVIGGSYSNPGNLNLATVTLGSNDTFDIGTLQSTIACWSLDERIWWAFTTDSVATNVLRPATAQSFTTNKPWQQYVFIITTSGTLVYQFGKSGSGGLVGDGDYVDYSDSTPANYVDPVTMYFQLNTVRWGTERKKRINKVKVICDPIGRKSTDTNVYSMYIGWAKEKVNAVASTDTTQANVRSIDLSTTTKENLGRYYISNIGQCRSLALFVALKHPGNLRVHGVELEVDQLTR